MSLYNEVHYPGSRGSRAGPAGSRAGPGEGPVQRDQMHYG